MSSDMNCSPKLMDHLLGVFLVLSGGRLSDLHDLRGKMFFWVQRQFPSANFRLSDFPIFNSLGSDICDFGGINKPKVGLRGI